MTSIVMPSPPTSPSVAPAITRSESTSTPDMRMPGAWVGTNPSTPRPISEDIQYLGERLKSVPATVQGDLPTKESSSQAASGLKDTTAAMIPASVMNTATNILPSSLQPTAGPTAADAQPPVPPTTAGNPPIPTTTNSVEHKALETPNDGTASGGSTLKDKAAALIPVGALSVAAAYLPSYLNPTAGPTAADIQPASTSTPKEVVAPSAPTNEKTEERIPTPNGTHEGLNGPLPPIPDSNAALSTAPRPLVGSTLSPDENVQNALSNSANPDQYKVEVVSPANISIDDTSGNQSVMDSTKAIGGTTPLLPTPKEDSNKRGEKVGEGLGALGVGAAVDHGLKDQKTVDAVQSDSGRFIETNDSFQHVVVPATPFTGEHEQEQWNKEALTDGVSKLDTKKHRKDRSESVSAEEASPSSPSKGGMFSGIRKLTKKKDRSISKGHSRDASMDDANVDRAVAPPAHEDSLDTQNSNSTGDSPSSPTKRERHVLHKDPPATHDVQANEAVDHDVPAPIAKDNGGSGSTPSSLSNPFSSSASSPTKVGFKDKIKGEFMSVSGTITRDHELKEAGEKLKKGTL